MPGPWTTAVISGPPGEWGPPLGVFAVECVALGWLGGEGECSSGVLQGQSAWISILALPLTSRVILSKELRHSHLNFLICRVGIITYPYQSGSDVLPLTPAKC